MVDSGIRLGVRAAGWPAEGGFVQGLGKPISTSFSEVARSRDGALVPVLDLGLPLSLPQSTEIANTVTAKPKVAMLAITVRGSRNMFFSSHVAVELESQLANRLSAGIPSIDFVIVTVEADLADFRSWATTATRSAVSGRP
jgi:hypothetical protein